MTKKVDFYNIQCMIQGVLSICFELTYESAQIKRFSRLLGMTPDFDEILDLVSKKASQFLENIIPNRPLCFANVGLKERAVYYRKII